MTDIYFSLRPGYEALAPEMIQYAEENMPDIDGKQQLIIFKGQKAVINAAQKAGYEQVGEYRDMIYEFDKPGEYDVAKFMECCWKGFDHEADEGPWNGNAEGGYHLCQAPHATMQHAVAIEDENGNYACWAGMWWTLENQSAYMEPLCTIPEHRHKGLASAALSELYRRMKPLGATHMTGGANPFYAKLGYKPMVTWTFWKKQRQ